MGKRNVDCGDLEGCRGYDWQRHGKIEHSCLCVDSFELQLWDRVETALGRVNRLPADCLELPDPAPQARLDGLNLMLHAHREDLRTVDFGRYVFWRFRKLIGRLEIDPMLQRRRGVGT